MLLSQFSSRFLDVFSSYFRYNGPMTFEAKKFLVIQWAATLEVSLFKEIFQNVAHNQ
jgi:hypothetical protein